MEHSSPAAISESVLTRLKQIAQDDLKLAPDQVRRIDSETSLIEGLQLDSLTQVVLLSELEVQYGIVLDSDDHEQLQRVETVGDLVQLITHRASSTRRSKAAEGLRSPQS